MDIDSNKLRHALIDIKEQITVTLDKVTKNSVRSVLISNIQVIEQILLWIAKSEKEGVINMDTLKIGLGKTVKLTDIERQPRSKLDQAIIEEASYLKEIGDAREIDPKAVKISYFTNRVYQLAREGRIHAAAAPVKAGSKLYIALKEKQKGRQKVDTK